jgi:MFS family permease
MNVRKTVQNTFLTSKILIFYLLYNNLTCYRTTFTETIITQWDLVCNRSYLASLAQTVTMLGILFGNMLFGYLSDRFGRRNPIICAVMLQVISGTAAAFTPWFIVFLVLRFLAALATGGTMVISFVLIMELVGRYQIRKHNLY